MSGNENSFHTPLEKLYHEIHSCHICCPPMDPFKALRLTDAVEPNIDVFIVSQALAEKQLRKSGVNFFNEGGILGDTGKRLELFLNRFNRTVYPTKAVTLDRGTMIRKANASLISVYNSEITQCFPGKIEGKKGDRVPTAKEIGTCLGQNFLKREIALIKPKLLLLMGNVSRIEFYNYFNGTCGTGGLQVHMDNIVKSGSIPTHQIGETSVSVLPIQHASGVNPAFNRMLKNDALIGLIRSVLERP